MLQWLKMLIVFWLESRETSSGDVRRCYSYFSGINETYKTLKHFKGKLRSRTELGKSCKNSISPRNPALKKRLEKFDFICAKVKKYLNKEENSEAKVSLIYFKKA